MTQFIERVELLNNQHLSEIWEKLSSNMKDIVAPTFMEHVFNKNSEYYNSYVWNQDKIEFKLVWETSKSSATVMVGENGLTWWQYIPEPIWNSKENYWKKSCSKHGIDIIDLIPFLSTIAIISVMEL